MRWKGTTKRKRAKEELTEFRENIPVLAEITFSDANSIAFKCGI